MIKVVLASTHDIDRENPEGKYGAALFNVRVVNTEEEFDKLQEELADTDLTDILHSEPIDVFYSPSESDAINKAKSYAISHKLRLLFG